MSLKRSAIQRKWFGMPVLLVGVLTLLLLSGCAAGNYGSFDRDRDLNRMFLSYEVLPDHNYYTTGGYDKPNAILVLHEDYELVDAENLWHRIYDVDRNQIRKWVDTISPEQDYRYTGGYFASYILTPDDKRVGAWYSYESMTTVKFLDGNRVQVYPPPLIQEFQFKRNLRMRSEL